MDSLELIETFREVVRCAGFSAAARSLGMSPANVSKYVAALEQRFGLRLFHRTTRRVTLTDAGQLLYERSGPMLEMLHLTRDELLTRASIPSGRLYLTAPHGVMQSRLSQLLGQFLECHPQVSLHLRVSNQHIDLVEEGVDIALRVGPIPDANLIVRRLLPMHFALAATPGYWQAHGRPSHPRELVEHRTLCVTPLGQSPQWLFTDQGRRLEVALQPLVDSTDALPLTTLALQGLGVVYLPRLMLEPHLASGALEAVLQEFVPHELYLYAAYAQRRHNSAALKALLEFLQQQAQAMCELATLAVAPTLSPAPAPTPARARQRRTP